MMSGKKNNSVDRHGPAAGSEDSFLNDATALPLQRLLSIARQSGIAEPSKCEVTLLLLSTSRMVRQGLQRVMKPLGMSEARFLSLVTLYTLDPMPANPANLAYHVDITRAAMTDNLDQMEKQGWVRRERVGSDRREVQVHLTEKGRVVAGAAIKRFLQATSNLSDQLQPAQHKVFDQVCRQLRQHAATISA
ncbi:MAG: MarR family transcriptional regulator [Nibricoccus sp.]